MIINTVKLSGYGYIVNDSSFVPNCELNKELQAVKKWITDGGDVEPEFSLDELKGIKKRELKLIRDKYKKEHSCQNDSNTVQNIRFSMCGKNEGNFLEYKLFIENLAIKYDNFKAQIDTSTNEEELNNINIKFEE